MAPTCILSIVRCAISLLLGGDSLTLPVQTIYIHPGSVLHLKKAPAIVYDELVRFLVLLATPMAMETLTLREMHQVLTTKRYARGVSSIDLSFIRSKVRPLSCRALL
jgi:hypothetical protein